MNDKNKIDKTKRIAIKIIIFVIATFLILSLYRSFSKIEHNVPIEDDFLANDDEGDSGMGSERDGSDATEDGATKSDDEKHDVNNDKNTIKYDESIPVSDRALIPEGSLYPDINMEAFNMFDGFGASIPGYQGAQRTSDAVTYPFTKSAMNSKELLTELEYEILKNPVVGDMIARGILEEYNEIINEEPWIKDFVDTSNEAYATYDNHNNSSGFYYWMAGYEFPDDKTGIYVTNEYRKYAESLCRLLETFINYGVHTFTAEKGYVGNLAVEGNRRAEILDCELTYPALILYKINEDEEVVCVIGFDLNDKGLFLYDLNVIQS